MRVQLSDQVVKFIRQLPPEPRRRLRQAMRELARGRGDILALEEPLDGYCRLRVGAYRVVFRYGPRDLIQCVFAEHRGIVYELLVELLESRGK